MLQQCHVFLGAQRKAFRMKRYVHLMLKTSWNLHANDLSFKHIFLVNLKEKRCVIFQANPSG